MYDFSKFCFKLDKADADILKKCIQSDLKNDLVTARYNVAIIIDIAR